MVDSHSNRKGGKCVMHHSAFGAVCGTPTRLAVGTKLPVGLSAAWPTHSIEDTSIGRLRMLIEAGVWPCSCEQIHQWSTRHPQRVNLALLLTFVRSGTFCKDGALGCHRAYGEARFYILSISMCFGNCFCWWQSAQLPMMGPLPGRQSELSHFYTNPP